MARRKPAYRKRRHNRLGMMLVTLCVAMMMVVVGVSSLDLKAKQQTYRDKEQLLEQQIAEEEARTEGLQEFEKYTKTNAYIEEVAKAKLGLVYEGEIIFKSGN